jgi:hypothetical protein
VVINAGNISVLRNKLTGSKLKGTLDLGSSSEGGGVLGRLGISSIRDGGEGGVTVTGEDIALVQLCQWILIYILAQRPSQLGSSAQGCLNCLIASEFTCSCIQLEHNSFVYLKMKERERSHSVVSLFLKYCILWAPNQGLGMLIPSVRS